MAVGRNVDALRLLGEIPQDSAVPPRRQVANARGLAHRWHGELLAARAAYAVALREAREAGACEGEATVLHNLSGIAYLEQSADEAVELARAALGKRRELDAAAVGVAKDLALLGAALEASGQLDEASRTLEEAQDRLVAALGDRDLDVAACRHNLALVRERRGDLPGAAAAYRQVLQAKEATVGPDHPELATTLANLASVLVHMGELDEARRVWRRAADLVSVLAPTHPAASTSRRVAQLLGEPSTEPAS